MVAWSRWEKHDGRILASQRLKYRKLVAEQVGIGFELPVQTAPVVPNVPKSEFAVDAEVAVNCSEVS
jgi:hypothetical protein